MVFDYQCAIKDLAESQTTQSLSLYIYKKCTVTSISQEIYKNLEYSWNVEVTSDNAGINNLNLELHTDAPLTVSLYPTSASATVEASSATRTFTLKLISETAGISNFNLVCESTFTNEMVVAQTNLAQVTLTTIDTGTLTLGDITDLLPIIGQEIS